MLSANKPTNQQCALKLEQGINDTIMTCNMIQPQPIT